MVSTWGQNSATCGDNAYWKLDSDGVFTISGTGAMQDYTFSNGVVNSPWWNVKDNIKNVVVDEGIITIGNNAFRSCSTLKSVSLAASITTIGDEAFSFSNLEYIDLSRCVGLTTIGKFTFLSCSTLKWASLAASITTIGIGAFWNSGLESIDLSGCTGLTTIDNLAFNACSALKSASLPPSITKISNQAFSFSALEYIDLSGCTGLVTIGSCAFYDCSALKWASLAASITTIGIGAFQDCSLLATITSLATVPPTLGTDVFANVDKSIPVIVPVGTIDAHKAADGWKEFTNISDGATGIVGTQGDNGFVVDGNKIVLSEVQQVTVYSLAGALIYQGYTDSITIDEAGMYIVKIASGAVKIVIR